MTRAAAFTALLAFACGTEDVRLGDGRIRAIQALPTDGGHDAGRRQNDGAAETDGGNVTLGFGEPRAITTLSGDDTGDDDPSLTSDLTEIYFDSKRDGGQGKEDIWSAERKSSTDAWDAPVVVTLLNGKERETGIALSADGLTIWFSSDRSESQGGLDVFMSRRASRSDAWSSVVRVPELSTDDDDLVSAVSDPETTCLLARRPKGTDAYDMYVSTRASPGDAWGPAAPIAELDTDKNESDAFLVEDGRVLVFTRTKDLVLARRAGATGPFTFEGGLVELNSKDDDRDPWATPDLRYVVFSSDRSGSYRLYEASR